MYARSPSTSKLPLKKSVTVSIAAGGNGSAVILPPSTELYFIKKINVTKGASITVTDIIIDDVSTGEIASFDCETVFGSVLTSQANIQLKGSNAGSAAENLTLEIVGYKTI
jgi:hypothetical protein